MLDLLAVLQVLQTRQQVDEHGPEEPVVVVPLLPGGDSTTSGQASQTSSKDGSSTFKDHFSSFPRLAVNLIIA